MIENENENENEMKTRGMKVIRQDWGERII